jgi:hypothetical protein
LYILRSEEKIEWDEDQIEEHAICGNNVRERNVLIHERGEKYDGINREKRVPKPFFIYQCAREIQCRGKDDPEGMNKGMPVDDGRTADRQKFYGIEKNDQRQDRDKDFQSLFIHGVSQILTQ